MTKKKDLETQVAEATAGEGKCLICGNTPLPDDTYLCGFQEPQNKRVALVLVCRTCYVVNTFALLRHVIADQWYARTSKD